MQIKFIIRIVFFSILNISQLWAAHGEGVNFNFANDPDNDLIIILGIGDESPDLLAGVSAKTNDDKVLTVTVFSVNGSTQNFVIDTSVCGDNTVIYRSVDLLGEPAFATLLFSVKDSIPPTITIIKPEIFLPLNSSEPDYKINATAIDDQDGDISNDIQTTLGDGQVFDSSIPGTYIVTYSVSDSCGNSAATKAAQYVVFDSIGPMFNISNASFDLDLNSPPPDLLAGVEAVDNIDGDVTSNITVTILKNNVTTVDQIITSALAVFKVTYRVEDQATNMTEIVYDYTIVDRVKPVISVVPLEVTVDVGDISVDLLSGVTISDNWDTGLLASINLTPNSLNTSALVDLDVTYNISDSSGNAAVEKSRTYHIVDRIKPLILVNMPVVELNVDDALPVGITEEISVTDNFYAIAASAIQISGSIPDPSTAGICTVIYNVTDGSGNTADTATRTYRIGKIVDPMDDSDNDGMEDQWEVDNLGDLRWNGVEDADRDGISNFVEFTFDTKPFAYDIHLTNGWNLVSLSRVPTNKSFASIFSKAIQENAVGHYVWAWDTVKQNFGISESLRAYKGYWLNSKKDITLSIDTELGPSFVSNPVNNTNTFPDSDMDGLDDDWEKLHFDNDLRWLGSDDADFDGLSNKDEFEANPQTDPNIYEIFVNKGWNLLSLPSVPLDNDITKIFKDSSNELVYLGKIWEWDADQKTYVTINSITPNRGFWIFSKKMASITIETD